MSVVRYSFAGCVLDTDAVALTVDGRSVPVQPQVVDVLAVLIDERERVVSKEELLDRVWGDRFVSESALTSRIKSARRAIGTTATWSGTPPRPTPSTAARSALC